MGGCTWHLGVWSAWNKWLLSIYKQIWVSAVCAMGSQPTTRIEGENLREDVWYSVCFLVGQVTHIPLGTDDAISGQGELPSTDTWMAIHTAAKRSVHTAGCLCLTMWWTAMLIITVSTERLPEKCSGNHFLYAHFFTREAFPNSTPKWQQPMNQENRVRKAPNLIKSSGSAWTIWPWGRSVKFFSLVPRFFGQCGRALYFLGLIVWSCGDTVQEMPGEF